VDGDRRVGVAGRSLEGYREGVRGGVDHVRRAGVGGRNLEVRHAVGHRGADGREEARRISKMTCVPGEAWLTFSGGPGRL